MARRGVGEGGVPYAESCFRRGFIVTISDFKPGGGALLQQARHCGAMESRKQAAVR